MYTFSSKLKLFYLNGFGSWNRLVLTAPKDIQEVESIFAAESHGAHGEVENHGDEKSMQHMAIRGHI
jgi:hypothetical protein